HVVANADEIVVRLSDHSEHRATVVGVDARTDVALLKIDASNLPALPFGDSDKLEVGEPVTAIGNPFGLDQTVTTGIVSAKERFIGSGPYDDFIQTDASINPGNIPRRGGDTAHSRGSAGREARKQPRRAWSPRRCRLSCRLGGDQARRYHPGVPG